MGLQQVQGRPDPFLRYVVESLPVTGRQPAQVIAFPPRRSIRCRLPVIPKSSGQIMANLLSMH